MQTKRNLVVGTDFSRDADRALEVVIKLAIVSAARITLVHVCELSAQDDDDDLLLKCDEELSRVVAMHRGRGIEVTAVLRSGSPWQKLDNVAAEVGATLIAIGRHGAGRGRRVEIGSVAEHLVRSASRPVLTVASNFACLVTEVLGQIHSQEKE